MAFLTELLKNPKVHLKAQKIPNNQGNPKPRVC